ncbi:MAG: DUF2946 family protein [Betaproteobacteria bacterium]|nr:DUF2946 family protein [Betaproteobacteria bacterium]
MDDIVLRAMQRWPNVPDVFGWLRLDRRGQWLLRRQPAEGGAPAGTAVFERIGNASFNGFISRNYQPDPRGRWFFQNGPQRVFVGLDCTPWVFRLDDAARGWLAHTGAPAGALRRLLFDETGGVLLVTDLGVGTVADRDLGALLERLRAAGGAAIDAGELLSGLRAGRSQHVELSGVRLVTELVAAAGLAARFGFDPEPGSAAAGVPPAAPNALNGTT